MHDKSQMQLYGTMQIRKLFWASSTAAGENTEWHKSDRYKRKMYNDFPDAKHDTYKENIIISQQQHWLIYENV
jgi:hypothetical protein